MNAGVQGPSARRVTKVVRGLVYYSKKESMSMGRCSFQKQIVVGFFPFSSLLPCDSPPSNFVAGVQRLIINRVTGTVWRFWGLAS